MKQRNNILYYLMTFFFWLANYTFVPYLATFVGGISSSQSQVGLVLGSYGVAQIIARIPISLWTGKNNSHLKFIRLGCFFIFIAPLGFYFFKSIGLLFFARLLCGIAASMWVPMSVLFSSYFSDKETVKKMSLLNSFNFMGILTASLISIPITNTYGIESSFLLGSFSGMCALICSFFITDNVIEKISFSVKDIFRTINNKWVIGVSILGINSQLLGFASIFGFTPNLALALGEKASRLPILQGISTFMGLLFSLFAARILKEKLNDYRTVIALISGHALITLLQPLMPNLIALYLLIFIEGIVRGGSMSLCLGLITLPFPRAKKTIVMGLYQAIYAIGIALGPMIAGIFVDYFSLSFAFYGTAMIAFLGLFIASILLKYSKEKELIGKL